MRKGQNPAKFVKDVARPERITVALLNYIPFLSGFYAETLDVLKVCMESMRTDAGLPFDLMVFDNGSCAEVRDFLIKEKEEGRIQYLILAEKNMGKGGAWNMILAGAPGEIIAYTDSDVLFSPKWLSRSVEILETFPNVGMVTACPFRTPPEFYESTLQWARENAKLEDGQFIPWETFLEFNLSLGQTEEENKKVYAETKDWRIQYKGVTAHGWRIALAIHRLQIHASTIPALRHGQADGTSPPVGQAHERRGLAAADGLDPLAMNMSNTLGYLRGELKAQTTKRKAGFGKRLLEVGFIKKILLAVYNKIFNWYYS